jgi:DNA helicase HerA-like ATPase
LDPVSENLDHQWKEQGGTLEEMQSTSAVFDNLNGEFHSRLRQISTTSRTTVDGKATITFKTARIEAAYSPSILKNIEPGRLVAIPNVMDVTTKEAYSIYEIADIYPMHYSMLTLDSSQPSIIRNEFMKLIEKGWEDGSSSTWIEMVGAPTGYSLYLNSNNNNEYKFVRKNQIPLTGAEVQLLSKDTIQRFICYTPQKSQSVEDLTIGSLLGITDSKIPFTLNLEKLLHYHVGLFAFTGSGKSNLTSVVMRKASRAIPNVKFVIFDVSAEYGINILDVLHQYPSRIITTEEGIGGQAIDEKAEDFLKRHVSPESLESSKNEILSSVKDIINDGKIRMLDIVSDEEETIQQYSTYGGLVRSIAELANEKYGVAAQKVLIPPIVNMIRTFMNERGFDDDSIITEEIIPLVNKVNEMLTQTKLRADSALLNIFKNLELILKYSPKMSTDDKKEQYTLQTLVNEMLSQDKNSPRLFVIDLPEADMARVFCAKVINEVFKSRRASFNLIPKIVFVFDEAQEFIPYEKKREDGTEFSSRAVERLLRHGRKYNLHGWISTQRIAHLNTNALQQLHSYFVSTMPRPYDRQLIADTFAIDDTFLDRTLSFENGDWLVTSFKATNTQSVPVFFHAFNNENSIVERK